jgi:hypothetical protein
VIKTVFWCFRWWIHIKSWACIVNCFHTIALILETFSVFVITQHFRILALHHTVHRIPERMICPSMQQAYRSYTTKLDLQIFLRIRSHHIQSILVSIGQGSFCICSFDSSKESFTTVFNISSIVSICCWS